MEVSGANPKSAGSSPFQLQGDRFFNIRHQLVEGFCLGDNRQIEALRDEMRIPAKDVHLDDPLHFFEDSQIA